MKKIVIIGAGPAGITAGYELLKNTNEYEVTILEESSEIGGISRTVQYNGNRMDIGGHRFFSKDEKVTAWWNAIMPKQGSPSFDDRVLARKVPLQIGGPDPEQEDCVMLSRNRVSRIYYKKKFFDYPVKMNMTTIKNMGFIATWKAGFSYLRAVIHKYPEDSLENFYINRFGRKLYSMFFEGYTEKLWGRHPREISADWGAQRIKGLSIIAILKDIISKILPNKKSMDHVETSLIEEFSYPKYGPGQLWETAAEEFIKMGGIIKKNCKVTNLITANNKIKAVQYEENGCENTIEAEHVISSMPLKDLIQGMNDVPEKIQKIAAGLPYRDFVTVGLLIKKLNLKNETKVKTMNNIVPDCWIYVQDTGVKLGRIQIFNNWSPYLVKDPEETVWIGLEYFCSEGDEYWNMSEEQWTNMGIQELIAMGVLSKAEVVLDAHYEKVKKAYPAYFDTYTEIDSLIQYLNQFDNLYCVGRNGQHRYNNMDHSMATSFEAVQNILHHVTDKQNIWNVNTEKEYHEAKDK
ncbi:NAD(P)/FAD-dependent oxidoreductase [Anaerosporobacter faecicola]|uniref:NAD(P)/FAD-dependent oxidoreductase n=1 Tax=Anaerosporobacter faecicola TaxID=2718714 RepID=UPI00143C4299|nr:NAD(P)/FAD-dependent oxidoreductase [Anaerosporobacter faecicola]